MMDGVPLAALLRPTNLDDFVGQKKLVGPNQPLRIMIEKGEAYSMIFWGPPGVGKTTLAKIIARSGKREFYEISAVAAGKADLKKIIDEQKLKANSLESMVYGPPIVFIDEIHRFNKAQQDYLLPFVENGVIILIGATTENPSFEVNGALMSRCRTFVFERLTENDLGELIDRGMMELTGGKNKKIEANSKNWLLNFANGDARQMLNLMQNAWQTFGKLDLETFKKTLQSSLRYDKDGEEHYDTISAFIKSMRAGETNAALYYLARMVAAGEDPKFIARRMIIFASEDVGLAVPTALVVANEVFEAVTKIGLPEAQINLAHGVAYLANCAKDRSAHDAYFLALADVRESGNLPVPMNIRNAPTKLMSKLGYGHGYEMYNESGASYLPEKLAKRNYLETARKNLRPHFIKNDSKTQTGDKKIKTVIKKDKIKVEKKIVKSGKTIDIDAQGRKTIW